MFLIALILLQNGLFIAAEVDVVKYLTQFGYLDVSQNAETDIFDSVAAFQEYFHLKVDGVVNNETVSLMEKPRCGIPDNLEIDAYSIANRWAKTNITWYLSYRNPPPRLKNVIIKAFESWQNVTNLNIQYGIFNPDIVISFARLQHMNNYRCLTGKCQYDFDGMGSTLGHAYLPSVNNTKCLEIHLDADEKWYYELDYNVPNGYISLLNVLTHEIGHILGLRHSAVQDAIMYPYYSNITKLSSDDIIAIQYLYGNKNKTVSTTTSTTPITSTTIRREIPSSSTTRTTTITISKNSSESGKEEEEEEVDICDFELKNMHFLVLKNNLYIIHKDRIWIMDLATKKLTTKNLSIHAILSFLPHFNNITAVYRRPLGDIALLINKQLYIIDSEDYKLKETINITHPFNNKKIIGAVNTYLGKTVYFFEDNYYMILNECNLTAHL